MNPNYLSVSESKLFTSVLIFSALLIVLRILLALMFAVVYILPVWYKGGSAATPVGCACYKLPEL